jgi:hypothetical protein
MTRNDIEFVSYVQNTNIISSPEKKDKIISTSNNVSEKKLNFDKNSVLSPKEEIQKNLRE